jgi:hypothetical protein
MVPRGSLHDARHSWVWRFVHWRDGSLNRLRERLQYRLDTRMWYHNRIFRMGPAAVARRRELCAVMAKELRNDSPDHEQSR